jgi:hypothetical protein
MSDQSNYNLIFDCSRFCYVSLCATQPGAIQGQILIRLDVGYNLFCKNKSVLKLRGDQLHGKITKSNFCFWIKSSNIYFLQVGKTVYQVRHKLYRDFKTDIHHIQHRQHQSHTTYVSLSIFCLFSLRCLQPICFTSR